MPASLPVIQRSSQLLSAALARQGPTEEAVKDWNPNQNAPPPLGTGGMTFAIRAPLRAIAGETPVITCERAAALPAASASGMRASSGPWTSQAMSRWSGLL